MSCIPYLRYVTVCAADISALAWALSMNACSLRGLNLCGNSIDDTAASKLAEALPANHALSKLGLARNWIGDVGATALANTLRLHRTLSVLDVSRNRIKNSGIEALNDAALHNGNVVELGLSGNRCSDRLLKTMMEDVQRALLDRRRRTSDGDVLMSRASSQRSSNAPSRDSSMSVRSSRSSYGGYTTASDSSQGLDGCCSRSAAGQSPNGKSQSHEWSNGQSMDGIARTVKLARIDAQPEDDSLLQPHRQEQPPSYAANGAAPCASGRTYHAGFSSWQATAAAFAGFNPDTQDSPVAHDFTPQPLQLAHSAPAAATGCGCSWSGANSNCDDCAVALHSSLTARIIADTTVNRSASLEAWFGSAKPGAGLNGLSKSLGIHSQPSLSNWMSDEAQAEVFKQLRASGSGAASRLSGSPAGISRMGSLGALGGLVRVNSAGVAARTSGEFARISKSGVAVLKSSGSIGSSTTTPLARGGSGPIASTRRTHCGSSRLSGAAEDADHAPATAIFCATALTVAYDPFDLDFPQVPLTPIEALADEQLLPEPGRIRMVAPVVPEAERSSSDLLLSPGSSTRFAWAARVSGGSRRFRGTADDGADGDDDNACAGDGGGWLLAADVRSDASLSEEEEDPLDLDEFFDPVML